MAVTLDFPAMDAFPSYLEALREGHVIGIQPTKTKEDLDRIETDAEEHLYTLNDQDGVVRLENGEKVKKVPYEHLWLMDGVTFIGDFSFRLELNDNLRLHGGHVGYGIRPSMQGKGFATLGLKMVVDRARDMHGMDKLLVTCSPENPASEKVIVKNGGVYQDTQANPFGYGPTKRFWIDVRKSA